MGDKSPKSTKKQADQKNSKTSANDKKKKDAIEAKHAPKVVAKPGGKK